MASSVAFGALQHRNFRLFFSGHLVSLVGWWMHQVAQPWLVLTLTGSAFWVGLVSAAGTVPVTVFTLLGGAVADRFPRRIVVITTQALSMMVALGLAAVVLVGDVTLVHVIVAASLLGLVAAFDIPGRQAFLVELVGKRDLMSAVALNSSAFNGSRVIGPAIGGVLIGLFGVGVCFLINGLSFVAVLVALLFIRVDAPPEVDRGSRGLGRELSAGIRFAWSDVRIRTILLSIGIASIFGFSFSVVLPVIARDVFQLGPTAFGVLVGAAGIGALVGGLLLAGLGHHLPRGTLVSWAPVLFGLVIAVAGLIRSFGALVPVLVLAGFFLIAHTATANTMIQTIVPDELRGRVVAVYGFAFVGLTPLGSILAGSVTEHFGPGVMLTGGGVVCAVVTGTAMLLTPSIRAPFASTG